MRYVSSSFLRNSRACISERDRFLDAAISGDSGDRVMIRRLKREVHIESPELDELDDRGIGHVDGEWCCCRRKIQGNSG